MSLFHTLGKLASMASLGPNTGSPGGFSLYSSEGIAGVGSLDANQHRVDRTHRQDDATHRAFDVNAAVDGPADSSSSIGEPGVVSHRHKVATRIRRSKIAAAASGASISSTSVVGPSTPTTSTSVKPAKPNNIDPRTDKPPGIGLQHGLETVNYGAEMGDSITSFARRLQGSPV